MRKLLFVLLMYLWSTSSFSQGEEDPSNYVKKTNIVPPSPSVAALGKYGSATSDLITGAATVSIPVFSLQVGKYSIPVTLSYSSSGLKVDEMQSQVGNGWALHAGGVVSRMVYDVPDEEAKRVFPPADISHNRREFNFFLQQANSADETTLTDAQPDRFSFSFMGYSGEFILDRALEPVLLKHSNLKIETNFADEAPWNFKIITPDGAQFYFGGAGAQEFSRGNSSGCGLDHQEVRSTGWFLTKAVYPNGDEANLTYTGLTTNNRSSISETLYKDYGPVKVCGSMCPVHNNTVCINYYFQTTRVLQEISTNRHGKIKFYYQQRSDLSDGSDLGDVLLNNIVLHNPDGEKLKSFSFEYSHIYCNYYYSNQWVISKDRNRSFLTRINEKDKEDNTVRFHGFEYTELSELPPRLSFAQDHWGYFNGEQNSTLIPTPEYLSQQKDFPMATANREPNEEYAQKGLLKKVTYPTGGFEEFAYEANTVYGNVLVYPPKTLVALTALGSLEAPTCGSTSQTFTAPFAQEQLLYVSADAYNYNDAVHQKALITLQDVTAGTYLHQENYAPGTNAQIIIQLLEDHVYRLTVQACGDGVRGDANMSYFATDPTFQTMNKKVGGVRVKSVTSTSDLSQQPQVKFYKYAAKNSLDRSSGQSTFTVHYDKNLETRIACSDPVISVNGDGFCTSYVMFSNTFYNLFMYPGSNIQYEYITESYGGDNFEGGGIEYKYSVRENERPNPIRGAEISGAPFSNYSIYGGRELEQLVFDKDSKKIKRVVSEYFDDPASSKNYYGYVVNLRVKLPQERSDITPSDDELDSYNYTKYEILSRWIYKSKETEYDYDQNGIEHLAQVNEFEYGSPAHALPTKLSTYNSKGEKLVTELKYPLDDILISAKSPWQSKLDLDSALVSCDTQYNNCVTDFNNQLLAITGAMNDILNECYELHKKDCRDCEAWDPTPIPCNMVDCEVRKENKYNQCLTDKGYYTKEAERDALLANYNCVQNLDTCVSNALSIYNQSITDYYTALDSAINAATDVHNKAILTLQRKWILDGVVEKVQYKIQSGLQKQLTRTSNKFKVWSGGVVEPQFIQSSMQTAPLETVMTFSDYDPKGNLLEYTGKDGITTSVFWGYNGMYAVAKIVGAGHTNALPHVNQSLLDAPVSDDQLQGELNNLRQNLTGALITTYTYEPLVGMTTQTDPNGITTYYEYDGFGRLVHIRDKDRNILKKYCYNYQGQAEECQADTNPIWQATGETTCMAVACAQNSSYTINMQHHREVDMNPASPGYKTAERWVSDNVQGSCETQPAWQLTGAYKCETADSTNTGNKILEEKDMNPCSPTYGSTRLGSIVPGCAECPKPQNWVVDSIYCEKDAYGKTTGYKTIREKNKEACSLDPGAVRYSTEYDATTCAPTACTTTTCSGAGKKCVNGVCETGVKVYTDSVEKTDGTYRCTYHYEWSDGTWSGDYIQTKTSPCPIY